MKSKILIRINSDPVSRILLADAGITPLENREIVGKLYRVKEKTFGQFKIAPFGKYGREIWIPLDCLTIL